MNLLPLVVWEGGSHTKKDHPLPGISPWLPCHTWLLSVSLQFLLAGKDLASAGRVLRERTGSEHVDRPGTRQGPRVSVSYLGAQGQAGSQGAWKGPCVCIPMGRFGSLLQDGRRSCSVAGRVGGRANQL